MALQLADQIYKEGAEIRIGTPIAPKNMTPNSEYVFHYRVPIVAFKLLSPESITSILQGWVRLKQKVAPEGGALLKINGVQVNATTGDIFIRGTIAADPETLSAGVNPLAILAVIGSIFAVIGLSGTLMAVYRVTGGEPSGPGGLDPCTNPGFVNYLTCQFRRIGWVAGGIVIGGFLVLALLLYKGRL